MNVSHSSLYQTQNQTLTLTLLLCGLAAFTAPSQTAAKDKGNLPSAEVLTYLRPVQEIDLASAESGVVSTILIKPGDAVTKGQEILRLNSSVIEAQLAQAEAQAKNEGRLKSAEAEYQIAKQRLAILDTLRGSGSTNQAEWDKAKATLAVTEGQYKAAQEESENLQHQAATIRAQLEQRILRSPIDGIATEITRDAGEAVEARRADIPDYLAKIVDLSQLIARVHMHAHLTETLKTGQQLQLKLDSPTGTLIEGTIRFISPTVDAATGLAEVHLIFDNESRQLRSGIPGTLMVPRTK